jgi:PPOX class probable F420-dependent enzyme
MDADAARTLFATARVARLATVGADGRPHLVPITFALEGDTLYTAVDHKPKRTTRLRRLQNVVANPGVSVLADHYDEQDWSALWWVRADGVARILAPDDPQRARVAALLQARYEQYRRRPPTGPAIAIAISRWSGWRAANARQG